MDILLISPHAVEKIFPLVQPAFQSILRGIEAEQAKLLLLQELRLLAGDPIYRLADLALERTCPAPLVPPLDIVAIGRAL